MLYSRQIKKGGKIVLKDRKKKNPLRERTKRKKLEGQKVGTLHAIREKKSGKKKS